MRESAPQKAVYEDLFALPENTTGQIIDGELIATPRPSRRHALAATVLGSRVTSSYYLGGGSGPGGWIILMEPEIRLGDNFVVPDLSGWKRERFPPDEEENWISVPPDWVCDVLSPNTHRVDKIQKMPLYARHGVRHLWLVDPGAKTLDAFRLESGRWVVLGTFAEADIVRAEPFEELEIDLEHLWLG